MAGRMYTIPYDMNQSKRYLADEIEQALCKAALQADGANQQLTIPLMTAFVQKTVTEGAAGSSEGAPAPAPGLPRGRTGRPRPQARP
jgi:hypothetical protein